MENVVKYTINSTHIMNIALMEKMDIMNHVKSFVGINCYALIGNEINKLNLKLW